MIGRRLLSQGHWSRSSGRGALCRRGSYGLCVESTLPPWPLWDGGQPRAERDPCGL